MIENTGIEPIKSLSSSLLAAAENPAAAEKVIREIYAYFAKVTAITGEDNKIEYLAAVPAAKGRALGLNHAAQCLLDFKRTTKFLKGMVAAIRDKQKEKPGQPVRVFYAGCGPYAPFLTLIAPFFSPGELQFSILEINEHSLRSAVKLIRDLNLGSYLVHEYLADAVTFTVPDAGTYDLVFSETLDALLYRECYVPILMNLLPQFNANLILLPENVQVLAKLQRPANTPLPDEDLGVIIDVRKAVADQNGSRSIPAKLPAVRVDFDRFTMTDYHSLLLETSVHVYKDIWLKTQESSLTLPLQMNLEQPFDFPAATFTYLLEPTVELTVQLEQRK